VRTRTTAALIGLAALAALSFGCGESERTSKAEGGRPGEAKKKSLELPTNFPTDVPVLQGSTLKATISQGGRTVVHLYTSASIADAGKFYVSAFKTRGWKVDSDYSTREMFVISATKGKTSCGVTISSEGKHTLVRLAVSQPEP
jgi:hypothetical protein